MLTIPDILQNSTLDITVLNGLLLTNDTVSSLPSVLGYIISNESFWEPLLNTMDKLKFKMTYGLVGNDAIGSSDDRFYYLSEVNPK